MTFGKGFTFIGSQVHYDKLGHNHWVDLLFFNRILHSLVVIVLKKGPFKTGYHGQLSHYLHILEDENPPVGIILCKTADKTFVKYVHQDYHRPMGVVTYKINQKKLEELLPYVNEMKKITITFDKKGRHLRVTAFFAYCVCVRLFLDLFFSFSGGQIEH